MDGDVTAAVNPEGQNGEKICAEQNQLIESSPKPEVVNTSASHDACKPSSGNDDVRQLNDVNESCPSCDDVFVCDDNDTRMV